ncbi:flavin monoamine oxidase family protein [Ralstonia pseudosolanacearum]|uniref:flavin monoamine oxidase family protein n=1 Tax=Ralstonia pseudosolanacearum TaxID=1310165 RepID=UPI000B3BA53E|nr:flavin monoamine oxidase family protein [Ralstonia pseudosolanacearum]ARU25539.1 hypothetical protein RSSE_p1356 [Ralstonia solanacearum]MDO3526611.1 flavin monoamine oxidase family protein [Ralstonia pseudosolanacearum]MDO3533067.1 flavin monoamine oxidase family protein [Ralstonia pseudosolanacearum]
MLTARIAIIGGGLSGLYAAALLEQHGIQDYVLLEARETFGGRILSVSADSGVRADEHHAPSAATERYDLGATWLWPALHADLAQVVEALGLETFEQFETGDMLLERSRSSAPTRVKGDRSSPPALRLVGGMGAFTDAIRDRLTTECLVCGHRVRRLRHLGDCIELEADDALGSMMCHRVGHVLLAVPPRLAATTIGFAPMLPETTMRRWQDCGTWMAPHAKYVAVFSKPFWREQRLSGEARSSVGPLAEIHDASAREGGAALFGFLGVPAQVRSRMPETILLSHCRAQLVRLFGERAGTPKAEFLKDWTSDPCTAVTADQNPALHDGVMLPSEAPSGVWRDRLTGIASEWSPDFSGYVAGAVDAAQRGVAKLLATLSH